MGALYLLHPSGTPTAVLASIRQPSRPLLAAGVNCTNVQFSVAIDTAAPALAAALRMHDRPVNSPFRPQHRPVPLHVSSDVCSRSYHCIVVYPFVQRYLEKDGPLGALKG